MVLEEEETVELEAGEFVRYMIMDPASTGTGRVKLKGWEHIDVIGRNWFHMAPEMWLRFRRGEAPRVEAQGACLKTLVKKFLKRFGITRRHTKNRDPFVIWFYAQPDSLGVLDVAKLLRRLDREYRTVWRPLMIPTLADRVRQVLDEDTSFACSAGMHFANSDPQRPVDRALISFMCSLVGGNDRTTFVKTSQPRWFREMRDKEDKEAMEEAASTTKKLTG